MFCRRLPSSSPLHVGSAAGSSASTKSRYPAITNSLPGSLVPSSAHSAGRSGRTRTWSSPAHKSSSCTPARASARPNRSAIASTRLRVDCIAHVSEVGVARELLDREHLASIWRAPPEHDAYVIQLITEPAREDHRVDAEAGQDLGQLQRMPEAVGQVADGRRWYAEPLAYDPAEQQVAHERLAAHEQLVGEHVAWADLESAAREQRAQPSLVLGSHLDVVLEHDRLAVERERGEGRILLEHLEDLVDHGAESELELLEREVPLAVPVRVGNDEAASRAAGEEISGGVHGPQPIVRYVAGRD